MEYKHTVIKMSQKYFLFMTNKYLIVLSIHKGICEYLHTYVFKYL